VSELQFKTKLQNRAAQFVRALTRAQIDSAIVEDSYRLYSVKISIHPNGRDAGKAIVYYSPKSDSFSLKLREMVDHSLDDILDEIWRGASDQNLDERYEIYVDGSFINNATGYGAVILRNDVVIDELCGPVGAGDVNGTRQVAGELVAVKEALKWCRAHSVDEAHLYYDYLGIEKWATGQWKTNQSLTKEYAQFVRACPIRIHWHKVASHTGNRWNDRADELAKGGAGLIQVSSDGSDLVSELIEVVDRWTEYLLINGIEGVFDRVYNEQFARIVIQENDRMAGYFDLYNTKKKRLSPYLHAFRDDGLKTRLEDVWQSFQSSRR
jgi:ribonuclease HI